MGGRMADSGLGQGIPRLSRQERIEGIHGLFAGVMDHVLGDGQFIAVIVQQGRITILGGNKLERDQAVAGAWYVVGIHGSALRFLPFQHRPKI